MKKRVYVHHVPLLYHADRPRSPWTMDGVHHMNDGNLIECECSDCYGYGFRYDTKAVPFDIGSDIEDLRISVKSNGCSLACVYRESKETAKAEIIAEYFDRVHSRLWAYGIREEKQTVFYEMEREEFKLFVEMFGGLSRESGKTYYKIKIRTTQKMVSWLEDRALPDPTT